MTNPLKIIQHKLDQIAMYRSVTLALLFIVVCSFGLSFAEILFYSPTQLALSLLLCLAIALPVNILFAKLLKIPANHESAVITALILFFLFLPPQNLDEAMWLAVATAVGVASKFILAWRKQHVFNAAAIGAVAVSLPYFLEAPWWVATPPLFIPLVIAGIAVVTKVRKWTPVLTFILVALLVFIYEELKFGSDVLTATETFFLSWPALFLAFFMLTEPFTLPGTKKFQVAYAAIVGFLSSTAIFVPFFAMTPELALVVGNLVFFPATLTQKLYLTFKEKNLVAKNTWEFIFDKPADMHFKAGQYLEWTVPHNKQDTRGQRRYFTIASAPEESIIRLALRVEEEKGSTYKKELMELQPGEQIIASQRAGDFLLPKDATKPISMVAGGIGVTPFLSHLAHAEATNRPSDINLYYCNNTSSDIAYSDVFKKYQDSLKFKVINVLGKETNPLYETGYINADMIKKHNPDYLERIWYLSGPPRMVDSYSQLLREMKVPNKQIKKDFFPGLA